jgi:uncharacterized protein (DUF2252 family)
LKLDGVKALPATEAQKSTIIKFMEDFAAKQSNSSFYKVLDVALRIAGTGSLGVERFVVLVEGKGSPDGNFLIDIKEAKPSALLEYLSTLQIKQPTWTTEAQRIVTTQKRMQAIDHAFLQDIMLDGVPRIMKGLQPSEDRVAISEWGGKLGTLKDVVETMGRILGWDQLRSSGRLGAACADELVEFAQRKDWTTEMLEASSELASKTEKQWRIFVESLNVPSNRNAT